MKWLAFLVVLTLATPALAADVTVELDTGRGFVIENDGGTVERFRVDEATGNISRNGALFVHTTSGGTFVGRRAGNTSPTVFPNTAFGSSALGENTTGGNNAAFGSYALGRNSTGNRNSAFGNGALGPGMHRVSAPDRRQRALPPRGGTQLEPAPKNTQKR